MKRTGKKLLVLVLAIVMCLSLGAPALAAAPRIINYSLYTEIVAKINGHVIRSYNIDGYTAVVAEDLRAYGFYAIWAPAERTLSVMRATNDDGSLQLPYRWGEYDPGELTHPIGSRAFPIYETDIKTYVAGSEVSAFNIDGETLIWIEDLAPFGDVVWHEKERYIELTLGDPVEIALAGWVNDLTKYSLLGSSYKIYDSTLGWLFVGTQSGLPHGSATYMHFVKNNGEVIEIHELLPPGGWGTCYYLNPMDIKLDGSRLTFITPVKENVVEPGKPSFTVKDWGPTRCVVDLNTGTMVSMEPAGEALETWSVTSSGYDELSEKGVLPDLFISAAPEGCSVKQAFYPGEGIMITANQNGVTIANYAALLPADGFEKTPYGAVYKKLVDIIPSVTTGESLENSESLRASVAECFAVYHNGQRVPGDLYRSQGNNHVDFEYRFDEPLTLNYGDTLQILILKLR